jgi:hypothetical protein
MVVTIMMGTDICFLKRMRDMQKLGLKQERQSLVGAVDAHLHI